MFKKILSISALSVSALLLILSVVDVLADQVALFQLLPIQLAVVLMLLLALAVTVVACIDGSWRHPLLLLACLLQTPVGGAMAVVWVYGLCFPEALPLEALFPYLTALTALASVIQATVVIVGEGMYEPVEEETENDVSASADEAVEEGSARGLAADALDTEETPAVAPASVPNVPKVKAAPRKAFLTADELDDADDELAPIPKKKRGGSAAAETTPPAADLAAPSVARQTPDEKVKTEPQKYTDPFDLLKEEAQFDQWKNSVKEIFAENKDGE